MGYASKAALMEYIKEKTGDRLFLTCFGIGVIFISFLAMSVYDNDPKNLIMIILIMAAGIFFITMGNSKTSKCKRFLKLLESTGQMDRLLNDFASSQALADDRIRLGAEYIYGKNQGRPVSYAELQKVYPSVVTGARCERKLMGITAEGAYVLCDFIVYKSQKDPHPDESYIYQVILSKNPNVYLGYK